MFLTFTYLLVELKHEEEAKGAIVVPDEAIVAQYYDHRQQLDQMVADFREVVTHPTYALPFLQAGRLVKIQHEKLNFGWGVIVNFTKRLPPKVRALRSNCRSLISVRTNPNSKQKNCLLMNSTSLMSSSTAHSGHPFLRIDLVPHPHPQASFHVRLDRRVPHLLSPLLSVPSRRLAKFVYIYPQIFGQTKDVKLSGRQSSKSSEGSPMESPPWTQSPTWASKTTSSRTSFR